MQPKLSGFSDTPILSLLSRRAVRVGGFAIACALTVILLCSSGPLISWDSEAYLAASHSLQTTGGIPRDWAAFGPLYPVLLAVFPPSLAIVGGVLINAIAFAFTGGLIAGMLPDDALSWWVLPALLLSPGLRLVHSFLLSEPVFIALMIGFVVGTKRRSVPIMMATAGLGALQRYAGVALIPAGIVALWVMNKRRSIPIFTAAALPVGIWMLRNFLFVGAPMGIRHETSSNFAITLGQTFDVLVAMLPMLIVAAGARPALLTAPARAALIAFCLGYTALIIYGSSATDLNAPDQRLFAPVFAGLVVLVAGSLRSTREQPTLDA